MCDVTRNRVHYNTRRSIASYIAPHVNFMFMKLNCGTNFYVRYSPCNKKHILTKCTNSLMSQMMAKEESEFVF